MRSLVPRLWGEKMLPGTAKTSRFWSAAQRAVMIAPLFRSPSITRTPRLIPDMMRLRRGEESPPGRGARGVSVMGGAVSGVSPGGFGFVGGGVIDWAPARAGRRRAPALL